MSDWEPIRVAAADVLARLDSFTLEAADEVCRELPQYAELPRPIVADAIRSSIVVAASAMRDRRAPTQDELDRLRATGAERARVGVDLDGPLRALTIASRVIWATQEKAAREAGAGGDLLLEAQELLWRLSELMGRQYLAGHREAELELTRRDYQQRVDLVRAILLGRTEPDLVAEQSISLGLDPGQPHVVFRGRPAAGGTVAELEQVLEASGTVVVMVPHERDLIGLMTDHPTVLTGVVGLADCARLGDAPGAFRRASRALATALRRGLEGGHTMGSLGVWPAVEADHELGDALVERYVLPLRTGRGYDADVEDSVAAYLELGQRLEETARSLHVHANTLRQRLRRFSDLTGADLTQSADQLAVWWAFQRRERPPT